MISTCGGKNPQCYDGIHPKRLKKYRMNLVLKYASLFKHISLYSTATQNHSRWVLALAWTPNATLLHYLYQHVGIFCLGDANLSRTIWNIGCVASYMQISCVGHVHFFFLCRFHLRWVANTNPISSGIWVIYFAA